MARATGTVYMEHPEHGVMPTYDPRHREEAQRAGWKVCDPPQVRLDQVRAEKVAAEEAEREALKEQLRAEIMAEMEAKPRRGRPPKNADNALAS